VKHLDVSLMLHDGELREHLNPRRHLGMFYDPDMKAAFAVGEPDDPSSIKIH
jgi:hypothetical protein